MKAERRLGAAVCQPLEERLLLARTIYVDVNSPAAPTNGSTWSTAYTDLQAALAVAVSGDTIKVADGTYKPTPGTDRTISFRLKTGVGIYGGYAGYGAADPDARDVTGCSSILSGDIGAGGDTSDNSYHVVACSLTDGTAVLDGFVITGGNADAADGYGYDCGGGMYTNASGPKVSNCTFTGNRASKGGGMYNGQQVTGPGPTLANCTFVGNMATKYSGGAIYGNHSSAELVNCIFSGNAATVGAGGGMYTTYGSPKLTNCTFSGNTADGSVHSGGGICTAGYGSAPTLVNCIFWGNTAAVSPQISQADGAVTKVTYSDIQGGYDGTGNINAEPAFVRNPRPGPDSIWGTSDDDYGDLHLQPFSPAADAGDNNAAGLGGITTDAGGGSRCLDVLTTPDTGSGNAPVVDMGAYETAGALAATVGGPYTVFRGHELILSGSGASGVAGPLQYAWEWSGDGKFDDATGPHPFFPTSTWPLLSVVTVSLRLTDSASLSVFRRTTVTILPTVFYVDERATGANNGTSWGNAFTSLATALTQAVEGQQIHVAGGTYKPTLTTDRSISFALKKGVSLLGGYAGGAVNPDARDLVLHPTVLSGDIGAAGDTTDNSYHVVVGSGTDGTAVLDGFTVRAGNASGSFPSDMGAGMYNSSGSPTVKDCTFIGNRASTNGGGMFNNASASPTLTGCIFRGNTAGAEGGGVFDDFTCSPTMTDCTFSGNSASAEGGGMFNNSSCSATLTRCSFSENAAGDGGGIWNVGGPLLTDCTFARNTASNGGGMYNGGTSYSAQNATLVACTFSGNTATNAFGGGMYNGAGQPTLANCTFSGNRATGVNGSGGGMYNDGGQPTLANCTFSGNMATGTAGSGGGLSNAGYYPFVALVNCILWGNTAATSPEICQAAGTLTITYSDIEDCVGTGNINADPLFVRRPGAGVDGNWGTADDDYGDLRLRRTSPCIDAGDNGGVTPGVSTDLGGIQRIVDVPGIRDPGAIVDMGAYEAPAVALPVLSINDVALLEGKSGTNAITFTVTLSAVSRQTVSVHYATANGTGVVNRDYLAANGDISFLPGQTTKTVRVLVKGDTIVEPNRTLKVNLSNPNNASIADTQGIGTVIDDDGVKLPRIIVALVSPTSPIATGQSTSVSFGSAKVGTIGSSRAFRVTNMGAANLSLGKISIPAGYQLTDGLTGTLAPGQSDTFTIVLSTKKAGKYSGTVRFVNNVAGKSPFRFSINGRVTV